VKPRLRRVLATLAVVLAVFAGGLIAVYSYRDHSTLSAGEISMSVSPFRHGALDLYVPLVDWGVRFGGVRAPARLTVSLVTVDRDVVGTIERAGLDGIRPVRAEARDAVAGYLKRLAVLTAVGGLLMGWLMLAAVRSREARGRRRFVPWALVFAGALLWPAVVAAWLAPRGSFDTPSYYAHGADIPSALRVVENASRASENLGQELDGQLLGLARLVTAPGNRTSIRGLPRLTVASDLHNNLFAIDAIKRAGSGGPVILPGDLTDRGSAAEVEAVSDLAHVGKPVVFVAGNHDSDLSERRFARRGVIVLTRRGRLLANGRHGPLVADVGGLRVAGYESPNMRRRADDYRDRGADISALEQAAFTAWLAPLVDKVDVVVVHEPALAAPAIDGLRKRHLGRALLFVEGHTHRQAVETRDGVSIVNGGTAGGGGTGNLLEHQPVGLAIVSYRRGPFAPIAVDLAELAPGTGGGTARRVRLDNGPLTVGDPMAASPEALQHLRVLSQAAVTAVTAPSGRPRSG
jgi:predicted phosphodiesterase